MFLEFGQNIKVRVFQIDLERLASAVLPNSVLKGKPQDGLVAASLRADKYDVRWVYPNIAERDALELNEFHIGPLVSRIDRGFIDLANATICDQVISFVKHP